MAQRRLNKELQDVQNAPSDGISVAIMDEDVFEWLAKIEGPNDSTYAGQTFDLMLHMSQDYPCSPPKVAFVTKVKHSKVNDNGAIDLEILTKEGWTGDFTVAKVLEQIRDMLKEG